MSAPLDFQDARATKVARERAEELADAWEAEGRPIEALAKLVEEWAAYAVDPTAIEPSGQVLVMHRAFEARRQRGTAQTGAEFISRMASALRDRAGGQSS